MSWIAGLLLALCVLWAMFWLTFGIVVGFRATVTGIIILLIAITPTVALVLIGHRLFGWFALPR